MLCCLHRKTKNKKNSFQSGFPECMGCDTRGREFLPRVPWLRLSGKRASSPSAWAVALGEEGVFPECHCCGSRGRGCLLRLLHSGKIFLKKEMTPTATNGVNSSPSARTTLGEVFPECTIFGSRGRRLSREEIPGALLRVQLAFPECF